MIYPVDSVIHLSNNPAKWAATEATIATVETSRTVGCLWIEESVDVEVDVESNLDVEDNAARKDVDEGAELVTEYEVNAGDEDAEDNDSDCFGIDRL